MNDLPNLVAISLLPSRLWRLAADLLRQGETAARVFSRLAAKRWPDDPSRAAALRADAAAAIARAAARGIASVPWSDPSYPSALATIVDPPAVLWTRGGVAPLD